MKIQLPDVTLIAVSSVEIEGTIFSLETSSRYIDFGKIVIVSHEKPKELPEKITYEKCPKLDGINPWNLYMFHNLGKHFQTSHCLVVHADSWVLNPTEWKDSWLQYDYIGAPWPVCYDAYICKETGEHVRVGNGGFSLRSKKLVNTPLEHNMPLLEEEGWYNEDGNICVYHRQKMLELGIKYAPVEVAAKFSFENNVVENFGINKFFGFHKNYPGVE